jgi:hypothetical protein
MEASRKVPDGKFVRLRLDGGTATITGDFFLHPEDAIGDIERIVGDHADDPAAVADRLDEYLDETGTELVGASPATFADLLREVDT